MWLQSAGSSTNGYWSDFNIVSGEDLYTAHLVSCGSEHERNLANSSKRQVLGSVLRSVCIFLVDCTKWMDRPPGLFSLLV